MKIFSKAVYLILVVVLSFCLVSPSVGANYLVAEGDVLEITVYDHPEITAIIRVGTEGTITVPLLDAVHVDGLSTGQISQDLTRLLADGYIVNPQVNVFIKEYRERKAVILGQVKSPGLYELRDKTTLLELISQAGGLTEAAGDLATLKREGMLSKAGQVKEVVIDLDRLVEQGDISLNIPIIDGDNIFIEKAGIFYVTGEVTKPDSYKFHDDLTIVKGLAMAGGFTDIADKDSVKLIRKIDGKEQVLEITSMDMRIQPDDVIVVPESFF